MIDAGGLTLLLGEAYRETFVTGTASAAGGKHIEEICRVTPIDHVASRPAVAEALAVDRLIRLTETIDCPLYLVHISTPEVVEATKATRAKGMKIWIETCPQYLYLTEEALNEYGAYAKCNPALRDKARVEKMWDYIEDGTIDTVESDYAPYTVEKEKMRTMAKDIAKVFDGWKLNGVVDKVILRGEVVYGDGQVTGEHGYGKCLLKGKA